jgi:hypothetical protein
MPQVCHSQNQREAHNRDNKKARKKSELKKLSMQKKKTGKKLKPKNRSFP